MGATPCSCARTADLKAIVREDEECKAAAAGLHPTMVER